MQVSVPQVTHHESGEEYHEIWCWQKKSHPVRDGHTIHLAMNRKYDSPTKIVPPMQVRHRVFTKFPIQFWTTLKGSSEIAVMLRIMLRMTGDGWGVCYESRDSIAEACDISPKKVTEVIKSLESKNLIRVERLHRRPHNITLHPDVRNILGGKIDLQTRSNTMDLDGESFLPSKEDQKMDQNESDKCPRNKIKPKKRRRKVSVTPKYVSEIDRIHEQYLKKKKKEEQGSE